MMIMAFLPSSRSLDLTGPLLTLSLPRRRRRGERRAQTVYSLLLLLKRGGKSQGEGEGNSALHLDRWCGVTFQKGGGYDNSVACSSCIHIFHMNIHMCRYIHICMQTFSRM